MALDLVAQGAFIPVALGVFAGLLQLPAWIADKREEWRAVTADQKAAVVHRRLERQYEAEGHHNPTQAASDQINGTIEAAWFRAAACEAYVGGQDLAKFRDSYWKHAAARMTDIGLITRDRADVARYVAAVRNVMFGMDEDGTYLEGEAAKRWVKQKAEREAEMAALRAMPIRRDPIADSVIEHMYAAGGRL